MTESSVFRSEPTFHQAVAEYDDAEVFDPLGDLTEFHTKFEFYDGWKPSEDSLFFRVDCMQEEIDEIYSAIRQRDQVGLVDGILDLIYFAFGTLDLLNVDTEEHWKAIHTANMRKERGTKSSRPHSGGYDAVKPEGWKSPDEAHAQLLAYTHPEGIFA